MGRFEKRGGGQFFGRGGFGRQSFNRGGDSGRGGEGRNYGPRGDREMFKTVCSNCGKDCEVPFRPTNSKPVYCNDCFPKFGGRSERRDDKPRFGDRRPSGGGGMDKGLLESINKKLERILNILEPKVESNSAAKEVESVEVAAPEVKVEEAKAEAKPKKASTKTKKAKEEKTQEAPTVESAPKE